MKIANEMVKYAKKYDEGSATSLEKAISLKDDEPRNVFGRHDFQGWAAHEACAGALYIFLHCNDPNEVIKAGVHTPGDSDSIAAMGAMLVAAYTGEFEHYDLDRLEGRDKLISLSKLQFYKSAKQEEKQKPKTESDSKVDSNYFNTVIDKLSKRLSSFMHTLFG